MMGGRGGDGGSLSGVQVENSIRNAYDKLPKAPGGWVGLAEIRETMPSRMPRSEVDKALRRLAHMPGVRVAPVDNPRGLREKDKAAALKMGDSPKHMIAFGR